MGCSPSGVGVLPPHQPEVLPVSLPRRQNQINALMSTWSSFGLSNAAFMSKGSRPNSQVAFESLLKALEVLTNAEQAGNGDLQIGKAS